ncbi:hypothetical protein GQ43DRAFT_73512, partial [Delitschia confertaspora ATCC 74209]
SKVRIRASINQTPATPPVAIHLSPSTCRHLRIMVPKPQGQSAAKSVTHRPLPPLPKLRVRRPNKPELNPCLGVMSSVLGM